MPSSAGVGVTAMNLVILAAGAYLGRISVSLPQEYDLWFLLRDGKERDCGEGSAFDLYFSSIIEAPLVVAELATLLGPPLLPLAAAGNLLHAAVTASQGLSDHRRRGSAIAALASSLPGIWTIVCAVVVLLVGWLGLPALSFMVFGVAGRDGDGSACGEEERAVAFSFFVVRGIGCCSWLLLLAVAWSSRAAATQSGSFTRGMGAIRGGVRGLTDRAIREHLRVHEFLYGSSREEPDDDGGGGGGGGGGGRSSGGAHDEGSTGKIEADNGSDGDGDAAGSSGHEESDIGHLAKDFPEAADV